MIFNELSTAKDIHCDRVRDIDSKTVQGALEGLYQKIEESEHDLTGKVVYKDYGQLSTGRDLDTLVEAGIAKVRGQVDHIPENEGYGVLVVDTNDSIDDPEGFEAMYVSQKFYSINGKVYERFLHNSQWTEWVSYVYEIDKVNESAVPENITCYPYSQVFSNGNPYNVNGCTFTVNSDGTITLKTTATGCTATTTYTISNRANLDRPHIDLEVGKTYTLTGCPQGGATSGTFRVSASYTKNGNPVSYGNDIGNGLTFTVKEKSEVAYGIVITVYAGFTSVTGVTFKPMLEEGSIAHRYQPAYYNRKYLYDSVSGANAIYNYELSVEKKVGKWVEGSTVKDLYQIVMTVPDNITDAVGERTFTYPTPITNLDMVVDAKMIARKYGANRNGAWQTFPTLHQFDSWKLSSLYNIGSTGCMFWIGNSYTGDHRIVNGRIILTYTKTS